MSKSRSIVMLGSLGLVVLVVASWFLLLSPRMAKAGELNEQRATVEQANAATQADINELEQMKADIDDAKSEAEKLSSRFPPTAETSNLYALIRDAAQKAGISESNVSDLTEGIPALGAADGAVTLPAGDPAAAAAPSGQLASMSLDLSVAGSKAQIIKFIEALEDMDRAYLINSVTFGDSEAGSTATINGNMYLLPELVDPTAPAEPTVPAEGTTDPATGVDPAAGETSPPPVP